ncbi:hypothetical protein BBK14_11395 [Parafrankia soli]|uniref:Uncharacterized protein n=1 Tax=Parafrankia soli TaxID=2599596 RepID=A0A1S1R5H9_9ACTN|nr:hypothetical protein BBK14_11395 [Parafrankia soli]
MTAAGMHVAHGYTMADVARHARIGMTMAASRAGNADDRYQAAWDAVVMTLAEADEPPSRRDLSVAASNAVEAQWHDYRHHHGINSRGAAAPRHAVYWLDLGGPTPSPEHRIVEREALARIWPELNDRDRAALTALATMGTYAAAAAAMGLDYRTFTERVRRARTRYLALWHEGETPSRLWRVDRRERTTDRWASKNRSDLLRRGAAISRREGRPHGTWTRYCSGCRCAGCKAEARRVNAAAYARRRAAAAGDAA